MTNDSIKFYSEAKLKDGHVHYGIASYNRINGIVTYLSDYAFTFI